MIESIRQAPEFNHIPLIVSSASSYDKDREQSLAAGANTFVPKPVEITFLLNVLQQQLYLEWIYSEEEIKTESQEQLVWPSTEILSELLELTNMGDIAALQEYANKLSKSKPQLTPFAARLQHLADSFQISQLKSFLESHRQA